MSGYARQVPRAPLSDFVALLWVQEGLTPEHPRERLLPTGTVELVVSLATEDLRVFGDERDGGVAEGGALVCGAHSRYFVIDTMAATATAGVHFRPGGAWPFFGVPADALMDAHVPLDALWGAGAAAGLRERLVEAPTPTDRFRVLEEALLARLALAPAAGHLAVRFGVRALHSARGPVSIRALAERIGISQRRFGQLFRAEVGLAPKVFSRIRRFQDVLDVAGPAPEVDWSRVALDCGFYDQAHFINEFRAFSGLTPSAYLRRRTGHRNHLRDDPA